MMEVKINTLIWIIFWYNQKRPISKQVKIKNTLKHKEDKTVDVLNTLITPINAEREISFH